MSSPHWPGLPDVVKSRFVPVGDLNMHVLECRPLTNISSTTKPPLILLLHGFPELGYSWRKTFAPLAEAGYYVVAPDHRGYGLTQKENTISYTDSLRPFHILNVAADSINLVYALGYNEVACVVGHDFGAYVAGWCALTRPDMMKRVMVMSAPFAGPPGVGSDSWMVRTKEESRPYLLDKELRKLNLPREHYMVHNSSSKAANEYLYPEEGLGAFLRAYYHTKSADWEGNFSPTPGPLKLDKLRPDEPILETVARAMEVMPHYYIMPADITMPAAVRPYAPTPVQVSQNTWLTEAELGVYTSIFQKTGFQGSLNYYRARTDETWNKEAAMRVMNGKGVEVPMRFLAGECDWGTWQFPGTVEAMKGLARCGWNDDEDFLIVPGAGHWVQQERPGEVVKAILEFVNGK